MFERRLIYPVILAFLMLQAFAPTGKTERSPARHPQPTDRLEIPEGEYVPMPLEDRQTSPAYQSVSPRFFTTQVNVDVVGANVVGDAANEPSIAVDPTGNLKMAIGWRQFETIQSSFRQAGYGYTTDGGRTWTFPGVIEPGIFRSDPVLDSDSQGTFYYNSLTFQNEDFFCNVFKSTDGGVTWDTGTFAWGGDKQWMVIDKTGGIGDGNIYAYWTSSYSYCYPGFFTRSIDGGASYEECITIPDDPFWGTLAVGPDGELYIGGGSFVVAKSSGAQDPGQSVTWDFSTPVDLDGDYGFGGGPNPGGLLGQAWIAVDNSQSWSRGNVYFLCSVDRFSTSDPLDVMFTRSTDGGLTWSSPVRVNDDPGNDAYQWFGTMSVAPNGRIDVIWLDTRDDPGGYYSSLYYSYSVDAGATWSTNERLTDSFDPHVGWPQQDKMGDYFDMISYETEAHIAYAATFNGEQDVYYGRITTDLYVPDNYLTIQEAIDASVDGNTIIVRPGTYHEHGIDFTGKAITVRSTDPEDSTVVASTIVDADSLGRGFYFHSGEDSTSALSGVTITKGFVVDAYGAGVLCENASSPTISNCAITGSYAHTRGGGIACREASSPVIRDCVVSGNEATMEGGGIICDDSSPEISSTTIEGNTAGGAGGGLFCGDESSPIILNNTITGNSAGSGGGISSRSVSTPTVTNTILWGNDAPVGQEMSVEDSSALTISYSDAEGGQDSVFVSESASFDWGPGMIDADPIFRDAGAGDYHLMATACGDTADSPCIDAGDPAIEDLVLDCTRGLGAIRSDIGTFGGGEDSQVSTDREGDQSDTGSMPKSFGLFQNYPNPFNPSTTIVFDIPGNSGITQKVNLTIYDLRGRKVKTLIDEDLVPGSHRIVWDGKSDAGEKMSSGIYFSMIRSGGFTGVRKMIMVK